MIDSNTSPARPRVSVVMAVLDGERYVRAAIESILAQTFTDFEFIIIDDGSRDGTAAILEDFTSRDARVRVLRNETNRGIACSANRGLRAARGEFIARMDHDDWSHPDRLRRQVEFLDANPDYILVGTAYDRMDENGHLTRLGIGGEPWWEVEWKLVFFDCIPNSTVLFRSDLMSKYEYFYDESLSVYEDYEHRLRTLAHGKACNLPAILGRYRVHNTSFTWKRAEEYERNTERFASAHLRRILAGVDAAVLDQMKPFYDCFFGRKAVSGPEASRIMRAWRKGAAAFARDRGLSPRERRALRRLTDRYLVRGLVFRSGMLRRPQVLAAFLAGSFEMLPGMIDEAFMVAGRRIRRSVGYDRLARALRA